MARGLARAGARVVVAARDEAKSKDAVKELEALGPGARAVTTDVTDEASVGRVIRATLEAFDRLDILVNNAGTNIRKPPHEVTLAEWRQVLDTNLTSAYLCSHAAYPAMKATGRGKIINIGSMMSIFGAGFAPAYAASKGGIVQFTRACASAWAQDNIQVNAVLPGWIDTALTRRAGEAVARRAPRAPPRLGGAHHALGHGRHRRAPRPRAAPPDRRARGRRRRQRRRRGVLPPGHRGLQRAVRQRRLRRRAHARHAPGAGAPHPRGARAAQGPGVESGDLRRRALPEDCRRCRARQGRLACRGAPARVRDGRGRVRSVHSREPREGPRRPGGGLRDAPARGRHRHLPRAAHA